MIVAEWDDDYVLDTDMRREDPLYYYVLKSEWKDAVGFQVDVLRQDSLVRDVAIAIFQAHLTRPGVATPEARKFVFLRVVSGLMKRYTSWKKVTICDDFLADMLPDLNTLFEQAGFEPVAAQSKATECTWRRRGWFARLFG